MPRRTLTAPGTAADLNGDDGVIRRRAVGEPLDEARTRQLSRLTRQIASTTLEAVAIRFGHPLHPSKSKYMVRARIWILILWGTMLLSASAGAQTTGPSLLGAWSWESPGRFGIDHNTLLFRPDGTYVRVSRWGNGTLMRFWGNYRAAPVSADQVRVQSQTVGWLPAAFCSQAPGFPVRCSPTPHPPEMSVVVTFRSPTVLQANGMILRRDNAPYLLDQQVPARTLSIVAAPAQPNLRQPVMPTLHPYTTPNGPGNAIANANHANAQTFINGYMRGCSTAPNGQLYGCNQ